MVPCRLFTLVPAQACTGVSCTICLQAFNDYALRMFSCPHMFHAACIDTWLNRKNTCPNCRTECEDTVLDEPLYKRRFRLFKSKKGIS